MMGWCVPSDHQSQFITPEMVLHAFQRIGLPESTIVVQPPDGETLVNFETNFYTEAKAFDRTVTLLGQEVVLNIRPSSYAWHYGDDTSDTTDTPGAPYPELIVTHKYEKTASVHVSVDTTWSAQFSVDGGPLLPVNGTVTIEGGRRPLRVLEATPVLIGEYY